MLTIVSISWRSHRVSLKELLILRLLIDNPKGLYGSEFVSITEGKLTRASIYTMLDRMVGKGYVRETVEPLASEAGIPRTRHSITAKGAREYHSRLEEQGLAIQPRVFARS